MRSKTAFRPLAEPCVCRNSRVFLRRLTSYCDFILCLSCDCVFALQAMMEAHAEARARVAELVRSAPALYPLRRGAAVATSLFALPLDLRTILILQEGAMATLEGERAGRELLIEGLNKMVGEVPPQFRPCARSSSDADADADGPKAPGRTHCASAGARALRLAPTLVPARSSPRHGRRGRRTRSASRLCLRRSAARRPRGTCAPARFLHAPGEWRAQDAGAALERNGAEQAAGVEMYLKCPF